MKPTHLARLAVGALLVACGSPRPRAPAVDPICAVRLDVELLLARLSEGRGLKATAPIDVQLLPPDEFVAKLATSGGGDDADAALRVAFAMRDDDGRPRASRSELRARNVGGFYDHVTKKLVVRADEPLGAFARTRSRLSHELEHALQDANFERARVEGRTFDEWNAVRAVYEGDATLAELVAVDPLHVERRIAQKVDAFSRVSLLFVEPTSAVYPLGATFLGRLHERGGFPAIDRVFSALPASTEQVLHPEKYVSGEQPVAVVASKITGTKTRVSMRMGELGVRFVLSRCAPEWEASAAAQGWGGDALTIGERANGELALRWVTTWDDEASARRFVEVLEEQRACWAQPTPTGGLTIPADREIVRRGKDVVLRAGDSAPLAALFALIGERPPDAPHVVELGEPSLLPAGTLVDRVYTDSVDGIQATVPDGLHTYVGSGALLVSTAGPPPRASLQLVTLDVYDVDDVFAATTATLDVDERESEIEDKPVVAAGYAGRLRRIRVQGATPLVASIEVLHACQGGLLLLTVTHGSEPDERLAKLAASLRPLPTATACKKK